MTTIFVTYTGTAADRFDRDYYVNAHMPLVKEAWGPLGLESADAFFPAGDGAGMIAVAICNFRDDAALEAAFASPRTPEVMADVARFTDLTPSRGRLLPL